MYSTIYIATLIFVSIAAIDVDHIPMGKHGKTYPSQTIYDKDGQYVRLVGPLYGKIEITGFTFPLSYWRKMNVSLAVTPTVEITSLFISGNIKFEGSTIYRFDQNVDYCISGGIDCPYLQGVTFHQTKSFTFGDFGLFPGWYEINIDMFTTDSKHQKYRVFRLELKAKILES